jgi:hypothetical protein
MGRKKMKPDSLITYGDGTTETYIGEFLDA